jgi:NAD-reducing hydrogenase large subunit
VEAGEMTRKIEIEPVTRIEGHGKVTLHLGDDGKVTEARFNIIEFRGLEKACEGLLFWEMPLFISRS